MVAADSLHVYLHIRHLLGFCKANSFLMHTITFLNHLVKQNFMTGEYFFLTFLPPCDIFASQRGDYMPNSISLRISTVISELGLTRTDFGKRINLSQGFISKLCSGVSEPSDRTIWDICREFNVNETWLRTGEGEMFMEIDADDEIAAYVARTLKDENAVYQRKILLFFSRLSPELLDELEKKAKEILGE